MRIYHYPEDLPAIPNPVLTIGTFDGVHLGHQQLIKKINEEANQCYGESVLLTFHPHPRQVLHPNDITLKLINTLEERIALLERYGIDHLIISTFSMGFSQIDPEQYVKEFLVGKIHPRTIVLGYDHHFGKDRQGDIDLMRKMGEELDFEVMEISKQEVERITISSTRIRKALLEGDITLANELLNHPFTLTGTVIKGHQIGAAIGFPTANIFVEDQHKIIPDTGIYAVQVKYNDQVFGGMLYIGDRPTFNGKEKTIEVNVFDLEADMYHQSLEITFHKRLRDDHKYHSIDKLKEQMLKDRAAARQFLNTLQP